MPSVYDVIDEILMRCLMMRSSCRSINVNDNYLFSIKCQRVIRDMHNIWRVQLNKARKGTFLEHLNYNQKHRDT